MTPNNPEQNKPEPTESWEGSKTEMSPGKKRYYKSIMEGETYHTFTGTELRGLLSQTRTDALREAVEVLEKELDGAYLWVPPDEWIVGLQVSIKAIKSLLTKPKDNER